MRFFGNRLSAGIAGITFDGDLRALTSSGLLPGLEDPKVQRLWPEASEYATDLRYDGKSTTFYSLGAAYEGSTWQVSGEVGYLSSQWTTLRDTLSAYLSVGKRYGNLTPYVLLATAKPLETIDAVVPPSNAVIDASTEIADVYSATDDYYSALGADQSALSLGLRWDVQNNLALKFQWDHTWISSGDLWSTGDTFDPILDTEVDLFTATLNWVF